MSHTSLRKITSSNVEQYDVYTATTGKLVGKIVYRETTSLWGAWTIGDNERIEYLNDYDSIALAQNAVDVASETLES